MRFQSLLLFSLFSLPFVAPSPLEALTVQDGPVKSTNSWSYDDCGHETDVVQIHSIAVSPDPPVPGEDLTITAAGYVMEIVEEGAYADVVVKIGLIKLLSKKFDVCEEARNANATVQCPVAKDEYTVVQTVHLPKEIPPGKFVVQVRGFTVDDRDMLCLNLKVDFMKKLPGFLW